MSALDALARLAAAEASPGAFGALRRALQAGDELGMSRDWARGLLKFGHEGMSPAARMARAAEMGFDTQTPLYRGLSRPYDPGHVNSYGGEFFATDPRVARVYAGSREDGTPFMMPVIAKTPGVVEDWGGSTFTKPPQRGVRMERMRDPRDPGLINRLLDRLVPRYRNEAVTISDARPSHQHINTFMRESPAAVTRVDNVNDLGGQQTQVFVADPSARRSIFATFDPARANRSGLLMGVGGGVVTSPALLALMRMQQEPMQEQT